MLVTASVHLSAKENKGSTLILLVDGVSPSPGSFSFFAFAFAFAFAVAGGPARRRMMKAHAAANADHVAAADA